MLDQSLIKSNFIGRDGFLWWIGQIAPAENQDDQINKAGWGNRYKVRILGYDSPNESELSNDNLRWAQVLLSPSDGSGAANYATNPKLRPGDTAFGFFLDGNDAQLPVIMGVFGRNAEVSIKEYTSPFGPFSGESSRIENDGSKLKQNQTNEQTTESQKSPYHLPPSVATNIPGQQISYSAAIGDSLPLATVLSSSKLNKISTEIENAIKFLENIKSYPNQAQEWIDKQVDKLCKEISKKIQGITSEIVSGVVNDSYEKLTPVLTKGASAIYDTTYSQFFASSKSISAAHLAGVEAQKATIGPVKELQKQIPCVISSIIDTLGGVIDNLLCSLLKGVANFVSCIIDQFMGTLLNSIIDLITSGLSAVLGGLSLLLSFSNFNLGDSIRKSTAGLLGIPLSKNCGEPTENLGDNIQKWKIGYGPEETQSVDLENILSLANKVNEIAIETTGIINSATGLVGDIAGAVGGIGGALGACYTGPPLSCLSPVVNIFGGGGFGAAALPIFGSIVNETASIIGAVLTSGGSGYINPPFVSIEDNCKKGYGATAQTVIENGQVTAIIFSSEGEGYTIGEPQDVSIASVYIENPGYNYQEDDIAIDNFGNEYELVITNGSIVRVTPPLNITEIPDLPVIKIFSKNKSKSSGSAARLKPVFGFKKEIEKAQKSAGRQRTLKQVIDCIT